MGVGIMLHFIALLWIMQSDAYGKQPGIGFKLPRY